MEFSDVVRRRRMVRNYDPDRPVPPEVTARLLGNAVRAPSAGFTQGWAFLVLDAAGDRDRFWAATTPAGREPRPGEDRPGEDRPGEDRPGEGRNRWLAGMRRAPLIVVPHASRSAYQDRYAEPDKAALTARRGSAGPAGAEPAGAAWPVPYWQIDAGFAALLMLLTAVDEGLGACFFGIPAERVEPFRVAFGVPGEFDPIGAITIGYRAPDHRSRSLRRGRRPIDQVVHRGSWNGHRAAAEHAGQRE